MEQRTKPSWPMWMSVAGAVGFAVIGTVVGVLLYTRGVIGSAGPVVAGALLPSLLLLRVVVLARRTRGRYLDLQQRLGVLGRLTSAERARAYDDRPTQATDQALAEAAELVRDAEALLQVRNPEAVTVVDRLDQLAQAWQPEADLTRQVRRALVAAHRLNRIWAEVNDVRAAS